MQTGCQVYALALLLPKLTFENTLAIAMAISHHYDDIICIGFQVFRIKIY